MDKVVFAFLERTIIFLFAGGDNEVQRTMLELINQLDGFDPRGNIKVRELLLLCSYQLYSFYRY
jgi:hypothetical protein